MRLNRYIALATGISRRNADKVIQEGQVTVDNSPAALGMEVSPESSVTINGKHIQLPHQQIIMLNKPKGIVCSRDGQGSRTIYDLLPPAMHNLKPVGRLDKDSSGLLLLTNDGELAQRLTHPSFQKEKVYEVTLDKSLAADDKKSIEQGVELEDGSSKLQLSGSDKQWTVTMHEGRNRQIRRTFEAVGYQVSTLHRTKFGDYRLQDLKFGHYQPYS